MANHTPQPCNDNPAYKLLYQLDEMQAVNVRYRMPGDKWMPASFVRVEHGALMPFEPYLLSMQ